MNRKNNKNSGGNRGAKQQVRSTHARVKTARGRTNSSTRWLQRHINDPYVEMTKKQGYRSRAAFKLLEIDEQFHILKNKACVIDLGCAPGGWLQVARRKCRDGATIIGIDLKEIEAIEGTHIICGDFYDDDSIAKIKELMPNKADLIMSDMAANACGNKQTDHLKIMALVEGSLEFARENLAADGDFIAKILRGGYDGELIHMAKRYFRSVKTFKPDSSYSDSAEIFLIARGFKLTDL
jgi:23S rRNA (uridine2552-2'-O)-methyltransferase